MSRVYTRNDGVVCQYIVGRVCSSYIQLVIESSALDRNL